MEKIFWKTKDKKPLTKDQIRAFSWIVKILKKDPKECTDLEKEVQKMYTNVIVF